MKVQYIKRWNAPIGKRLCTTCNVVQKNDQFTGNLKMCRECTNDRHRAYVARYKQAQIEAGVVFRPKGRPRLSESVKEKRAEDKEAEKMAKKKQGQKPEPSSRPRHLVRPRRRRRIEKIIDKSKYVF